MYSLYINEQYVVDIDYFAERLMSDKNKAQHYLIMKKEFAPIDFLSTFPIEYLQDNSIKIIEVKENNEILWHSEEFSKIQDVDIVRVGVNDDDNSAIWRFVKADANTF